MLLLRLICSCKDVRLNYMYYPTEDKNIYNIVGISSELWYEIQCLIIKCIVCDAYMYTFLPSKYASQERYVPLGSVEAKDSNTI